MPVLIRIPVQEKYLMVHTWRYIPLRAALLSFRNQIDVGHRSFTKFLLMSDISTVLEFEHHGIYIRTTLKVPKCAAGRGWKGSVGPTVWKSSKANFPAENLYRILHILDSNLTLEIVIKIEVYTVVHLRYSTSCYNTSITFTNFNRS
jgi:hypothetical protein